jgi:hypothetical protein
MKLDYINILKVASYEPGYKENQYRAQVKYSNQHGNVELQLTPELTDKILAIVADDLVKASREVAETLTSRTIIQAQLEAPKEADEPF